MSEIVDHSIEIQQPESESTDSTTSGLQGLIDHKFETHSGDATSIHHVNGSREGYRQTQVLYLRRLGSLSLRTRLERNLGESEDYTGYRIDYWHENNWQQLISNSPRRIDRIPGFSIDQGGIVQDRRTGEPVKPLKKAILYTRILFGRPE